MRIFVKTVFALLIVILLVNVVGTIMVYEYKQRVRVYEGMGALSGVRDTIMKSFERTKKLPADFSSFIAQSRFEGAAFTLRADGLRLVAVFDPYQGESSGKSISLAARIDAANGAVTWKCSSEDIPPKFLQPECR